MSRPGPLLPTVYQPWRGQTATVHPGWLPFCKILLPRPTAPLLYLFLIDDISCPTLLLVNDGHWRRWERVLSGLPRRSDGVGFSSRIAAEVPLVCRLAFLLFRMLRDRSRYHCDPWRWTHGFVYTLLTRRRNCDAEWEWEFWEEMSCQYLIHRDGVRISPSFRARYRSWWSAQRTPLSALLAILLLTRRTVGRPDATVASLSPSILNVRVFLPSILTVATQSRTFVVPKCRLFCRPSAWCSAADGADISTFTFTISRLKIGNASPSVLHGIIKAFVRGPRRVYNTPAHFLRLLHLSGVG